MEEVPPRFAAHLSDLGVTAEVGAALPGWARRSDDDRASDTWHVNSGLGFAKNYVQSLGRVAGQQGVVPIA